MGKRRTMTMDGNTATAYASYAFTEVATIFPITPSSVMAENIDEWSANGRQNIFGHRVFVKQMQSEAGAAGAMHGTLQGGALCSTYTSSQGLMLMFPVMHRIAGELLPGVFNVAARCIGTNSLSIFCDHQDVMQTRATGCIILSSGSVQECMDMTAVAHLTAIKASLPVVHFFDGFRTSHEVQKIEVLEYDELAKLVDQDALQRFRDKALNPDHPVMRGITQNPDMYFQLREATNKFYTPVPEIVQGYMDDIKEITDHEYKLYDYYGDPEAEYVLVAMGSSTYVIQETIDYWNARGKKYGLLTVHLFRPFVSEMVVDAIPETAKRICVLDRTKEPGTDGEPLYLDVRNAFYDSDRKPMIIGGRYGLSSKEFAPEHVLAVFENLESETPKNQFTVGIIDDVTFLSLPKTEVEFDSAPEGVTACKFWGLGSDGTVGANKQAVKIIGDHTDMYAQAYFAYDSKKSGGLTMSHLRFGKNPIKSAYQVNNADFIGCSNQTYVDKYELIEDIKEGGTFLLNCIWSPEELEKHLPASLKREIAAKKVNFYTINAVDIAKEIGLGGRINMVVQSAFFKLANILPIDEAIGYLKDSAEKSYAKRGQDVVEMNWKAIDAGADRLVKIDVPESWLTAEDEPKVERETSEFYQKIVVPVNRQQADKLPVSVLNGYEDGAYELGVTQYEKRGISLSVPKWDPEKCIQCNQCAFVCPHSVLRPLLLTDEQVAGAPASCDIVDSKGAETRKFTMAISPLDCTGCGNCVYACPAKEKAIEMVNIDDVLEKQDESWYYLKDIEVTDIPAAQKATVKGSQFLKPYLEFSGACAGCGETPYAKLITQLYGDRMSVSQTAGCVAVWGGAAPGIAYTTDQNGYGPAFGYSLFEDDAEFGYGMCIGSKKIRDDLYEKALRALEAGVPADVEPAMKAWVDGFKDAEGTRARSDAFAKVLAGYEDDPVLGEFARHTDYLTKRSYWVFGGDGWAYDIGFGGLDHVVASGENINIFVFDTEVYSNTGGQSSKSTQRSAVAKFAAAGKESKKKDLGRMLMSYGNIYVASVCLGSDRAQTVKAIVEAEAYDGPSVIIAYAPCINHGIRAGMGTAQYEQKLAVETGYWNLYRYDPQRSAAGENPFILDSKAPSKPLAEFLDSETRFLSLKKAFPERAELLYQQEVKDTEERYAYYKFLSENNLG